MTWAPGLDPTQDLGYLGAMAPKNSPNSGKKKAKPNAPSAKGLSRRASRTRAQKKREEALAKKKAAEPEPFKVVGHQDKWPNLVRVKGLPPWLDPSIPGNNVGGRPPESIRLMYREIVSLEGVAFCSDVMNDPYRSDKAKKEVLELATKISLGFKGAAEDETAEVDLPQMSIVVATAPPDIPDDL